MTMGASEYFVWLIIGGVASVLYGLIIISVVVHFLGVVGIGDGMPWTVSKKDRQKEAGEK